MQLDPLTDDYPFLTPYQYASNDPITNIDIDGLEGGSAVGGIIGGGGGVVTAASNMAEVIIRSTPRVLTTGLAKTAALSLGAKMGIAVKGANFINNTFITQREVGESTCQGCHQTPRIAPKAPAPNYHTTQASVGLPRVNFLTAAQKVKLKEATDIIVKFRREQIDRAQDTRAGDGIPGIGPMVKGLRRLFKGDKEGFLTNFGGGSIEVILMAEGGPLLGGGSAAAMEEGMTVFRAVDATEAAIVKSTSRFSLQEGGVEVKYFAKSLEDAHWYGQRLYPNGYSIIKATVKGPTNRFWYPDIDIGAYVFPKEALPKIIPH
jgi:hypothetical protein